MIIKQLDYKIWDVVRIREDNWWMWISNDMRKYLGKTMTICDKTVWRYKFTEDSSNSSRPEFMIDGRLENKVPKEHDLFSFLKNSFNLK